jgi:hypothetical protein
MKFIVALLLIAFLLPTISAQTSPDEDSWFRYCIGVKGWFYSSSDCNIGRRPKFQSLELELKQDAITLETSGILTESGLRTGVYFDHVLKGTGRFESDLFTEAIIEGSNTNLHYDLRVTEINNDTHIYGLFFKDTGRIIGLNPTEKFGASDPCSNNFNWASNRESYEIQLNVIVDDPVSLELLKDSDGLINSRLNADNDPLTLKIGGFYENSMGSPRIQVAVGSDPKNANWQTIPYVSIVPNSTIQLFYAQIVGGKNAQKYNEWLGKNLMFRVSKTLMNGKESFGQVATGVHFDPPGPQFYIPQVTRSACVDGQVNIFVHLNDARDKW